jgi:hypothetical protein
MKTEDLIKSLDQYRHALIKNGKPPAENGFSFDSFIRRLEEFDVTEEGKQSAEFYKNMQKAGVNIDVVFAYHQFRDQVQDYQKQYNISSIIDSTINLFGEDFIYKRCNDQLFLTNDDKAILKNEVSRIVDYFLKLVNQYEYVLIETEDDSDWGISISSKKIKSLSIKSDYAWLSQSSFKFETQNTGVIIKKILPDEIYLFLNEGSVMFTALNPNTNKNWIENLRKV